MTWSQISFMVSVFPGVLQQAPSQRAFFCRRLETASLKLRCTSNWSNDSTMSGHYTVCLVHEAREPSNVWVGDVKINSWWTEVKSVGSASVCFSKCGYLLDLQPAMLEIIRDKENQFNYLKMFFSLLDLVFFAHAAITFIHKAGCRDRHSTWHVLSAY